MARSSIKLVGGTAIVGVLAIAGLAPALAATAPHPRAHLARHSVPKASARTSATPAPARSNGETALTGSTLSSADAAALAAVPGGAITRATTETDGTNSSAVYEVHVTKAGGRTQVVVLEDSAFKVLSVSAGHSCAGGPGSPGPRGSADFRPGGQFGPPPQGV
jgi:hypothetical protein